MDRLTIKFFFFLLAAAFYGLTWIFRKKIPYNFYPTGNYNRDISQKQKNNIRFTHIFISLVLTAMVFGGLYEVPAVALLLNNNAVIRLSSLFFLWLLNWIITGLLIERFLMMTDDNYRRRKGNSVD